MTSGLAGVEDAGVRLVFDFWVQVARRDYDPPMRYDIYGRFRVEMIRDGDRWLAYRIGEGIRRPEPDVQIPPEVAPSDLVQALEDVFHEFAQPGRSIQQLPGTKENN